MAASLAAAGQGASVILIETNGLVGGNTLVSGMGWNAVDPDANQNIESKEGQFALLQEFLDMDEADVEDYAPILSTLKKQIQEYLAGDTSRLFDSVELHIMQFWTGCRRQGLDGTWIKPDLELVKEFAYNSLDGIKWLQSYGIEFKDSISTVAGGLWQRGHTFKAVSYTHLDVYKRQETTLLANTPAGGLYSSVLRGRPNAPASICWAPKRPLSSMNGRRSGALRQPSPR